MKKYLKLFLVTVFMGLTVSFVSCSKDDDDISKDDIIGTWQISKISTDGIDYISWPFEATYATVNADGTYYGHGYFGSGSGNWKKKGNTIYTYYEGEELYKYEILNLTSTTLSVKMSSEDSNTNLWLQCFKR